MPIAIGMSTTMITTAITTESILISIGHFRARMTVKMQNVALRSIPLQSGKTRISLGRELKTQDS